jgi:hypothetical protein
MATAALDQAPLSQLADLFIRVAHLSQNAANRALREVSSPRARDRRNHTVREQRRQHFLTRHETEEYSRIRPTHEEQHLPLARRRRVEIPLLRRAGAPRPRAPPARRRRVEPDGLLDRAAVDAAHGELRRGARARVDEEAEGQPVWVRERVGLEGREQLRRREVRGRAGGVQEREARLVRGVGGLAEQLGVDELVEGREARAA